MSIYDNFVPTYLYIKQHAVTGLLYFGKTEQKDPIKYLGSGKYWYKHICKHGKSHVVTLWYQLFTNRDELTSFALKFSKEMNIVESKSWANLIEENGLDGVSCGSMHSNTTWFNNGIKNTRAEFCPNGFVAGKLVLQKKFWVNNGVDEYMSVDCPKGYTLGRIKNPNFSEKMKLVMNSANVKTKLLGRVVSDETRVKMRVARLNYLNQ